MATERRGTGPRTRRQTAIPLAATAALALTGTTACASRPPTPSPADRPLPSNQEPAAAVRAAAHARQRSPKAAPTPTPSTTDPGWTSDQLAETGLEAILLGQPPQFKFTPEANPAAAGRPPLEIITMPMWLWVDTPALKTQVVPGNHVIVAQIVIDKVLWNIPNAPTLACDGTAPNHGAGTPYDSALDPANLAPALPQPCITSFTAPYYSSALGTASPTDGVYNLNGAVTWHVAWTAASAAGVPIANGATPPVPSALGVPVQFRVGEIQALATAP
jgi:hypothetical protein